MVIYDKDKSDDKGCHGAQDLVIDLKAVMYDEMNIICRRKYYG